MKFPESGGSIRVTEMGWGARGKSLLNGLCLTHKLI